MDQEVLRNELLRIRKHFKGDIFIEEFHRLQYATDASVYREVPLAVARPMDKDDIRLLVIFARDHQTSLIPRTAGTSLAGQVVGPGIVMDVSRYMTRILELNVQEKWIRVEPGVVLDELNKFLEPYKLFFGPETSTANRCMIGGMVGNNACGAHSLLYGSTRDHTLELKTILSDGSEVEFKPLSKVEFHSKCQGNTLENAIYRNINNILSDPDNQPEIREQYPDKKIRRRNTGYALDLLLETDPFTGNGIPFNFSKLLAGSEGTLAFTTEIKLNLVALPPKEKGLICVHLDSLEDAFHANLIALTFNPGAIELMDQLILEQTKTNIEQRKNRFFLKGDPAAILIIEFARETRQDITEIAEKLEYALRKAGYGYYFPLLFGADIPKIWALRKAGLGILSNLPGDGKPVSVIEDTAVNPEVLPDYMREFNKMLDGFGVNCVYHAHIATGELHLRPVLNLKDNIGVELFQKIALETAKLVKKYRGSLSGEHGDGRVRGEFIPIILGARNYELLRSVKSAWDKASIFNPGKIVDTPSITTDLRYKPGSVTREIPTIFDFSPTQGILRAVEQCNGSGDCRKSALIGGLMCPSYMATRDENTTTRARANILREFLTNSPLTNPFNHPEIFEVMDLCLSCKGCKSECPSNVDITKLKAEFLQHYYDANGTPLRTRAIANINRIHKLASALPGLYNAFIQNKQMSRLINRIMGLHPSRKLPRLYSSTLRKWAEQHSEGSPYPTGLSHKGRLYLFADEFTNFNDALIGIKAILLLEELGYEIVIPDHLESGRTYLSKGLLRKARLIAEKNVAMLAGQVNETTPLIGIEPSAILSFRDEYPELVSDNLKDKARELAANVMLIDEFIAREYLNGNIPAVLFTEEPKKIIVHGHCHQKVLTTTAFTKQMLSIPANYQVEEIPSGCCGMAGSFGYEKEHYEVSMKIGELVLFPAIRNAREETLVAAPGTSCRHQIMDGTGRRAYHPVEILYNALNRSSPL
jgi:FAD/FMN-containing dehydrogenase/Fe-S oxidoreductase